MFGLRWLFRKLKVYPNGYYNYLKRRKEAHFQRKADVQRKIVSIYHGRQGVPGYRMMQKLLIPYGFVLSQVTIHKYMKELGLKSIVRRKKSGYRKGSAHKVFPDLLNQKFSAEGPNRIWCVDFTYLYLIGGRVRISSPNWLCVSYSWPQNDINQLRVSAFTAIKVANLLRRSLFVLAKPGSSSKV